MKPPVFGRKNIQAEPPSGPPPPADPKQQPGHQAVLARLAEADRSDPLMRLRLAGQILFDLVYRIIGNERGARIEDMLGILGATGGFSCIVGVMEMLQRSGQAPQAVGMMVVEGKDGQTYYFGDLPNRLLLESELSLLSLTLGAAHALGAAVSLAQVEEVMRHVAGTVGGDEFGQPRLPAEHRPGDRPIEYVRHLWKPVREALDLYEVPPDKRASAIGFAVQQAIDNGKGMLDPLLATRIVTEYAVPMAKIDPGTYG